ncbi:MAG: hypothetical protein NT061_09340 [Spirochaetes bacterium]|nr:hypothetical protein [Spirochaetota bacterium]
MSEHHGKSRRPHSGDRPRPRPGLKTQPSVYSQSGRSTHAQEPPRTEVPRLEPLQSFKLGEDCLKALTELPSILDEIAPMTPRQKHELGRSVRSLWEDLTSEKEHRTAEYLSSPADASAYMRYFLPWNLIRLASIFSSLPLQLDDGASVMDIGSGPLTLPIALYLSRSDLRSKRLTFYCADKTERILKQGQNLFESICARVSGALSPWKIVLLHQQFGDYPPEKVDLVTAANVFNEFFWKSKAPLGMRASLTARQLLGYLKGLGSVFLMEPGDPRSGSFISAIRAALSTFGALPAAPCPHVFACPLPGIFRSLETPGNESPTVLGAKHFRELVMPKRREKYPWCHFTIGTGATPPWLKALSDEAGLSKEKLVFSYLLSTVPAELPQPGNQKSKPGGQSFTRVVSEEFPLPGRLLGRYACSAEGYSLVQYPPSGRKPSSGDLLRTPFTSKDHVIDEKSGAIIVSY